MNIPDVVRIEADVNLLDASYSDRAYTVIAEWARREALREAAEAVSRAIRAFAELDNE